MHPIILLLAALLLLPSTVLALDLAELIRSVETQYSGESSYSKVRLHIETGNYSRTLEMEGWSLGRDYFLTRILAPAKDRGVATLKAGQDVWNYLPRVDRVMKIPASMMGGSWMGSHITNDDLVKGSRVDEDYALRLLEQSDEHYLIECLPHPEAVVVWGKIHYRIQRPELLPAEVVYFDEAMEPVRRMRFEDVRSIDGRRLPLRVIVQPLDKPQEKTTMQYQDIDFGADPDRDFFSLRNLQKRL